MRTVHLSTKLSTAVSDTHLDASFREPRAHFAKYLDGVVVGWEMSARRRLSVL